MASRRIAVSAFPRLAEARVFNLFTTAAPGAGGELTLVDIGAAGGVQRKWRQHWRRIEPVEGYEGNLACVNAYFARAKAEQPALTQDHRPKFALLQRIGGLNGT
jgi:hypothetical protein